MNRYGFVKVAAASPRLKVANPEYNISQIYNIMNEADKRGAAIIVFPELCVTGYTCGDLFHQKFLLNKSMEALKTLAEKSKELAVLSLVGMPLFVEGKLYNCAVAIQRGKLIGIVPKINIPNYKEYYEKRWFSSGYEAGRSLKEVCLFDKKVPFGNIIFKSKELNFSLGIEICEDLWAPIPPSSYLILNGADIIANLSASNELVAKSEYRRQLISQQSARGICAYLYASAGVHESTTDVVFGGECIICENGIILETSRRFSRENEVIYSDIDIERLNAERRLNKSFADNVDFYSKHAEYHLVELEYNRDYYVTRDNFDRKVDKNPFVPKDSSTMTERCQEIFNIQVAGLAKRLEHTGMKNAVIGVSGGLDSTLALLVTRKTFDLLGIPSKNIMAVTMPGFGTTDETYNNAMELMRSLNVTIKEIDIKEACLRHFKDIEHDTNIHDVTYENTQARERTQILMDLANKVNGLVVGTGDLSELALGWCTYNGDHMSMYAVNAGVPKTLVKFLVEWVANNEMSGDSRIILKKILDTPISPELLPPDKPGKINQKTEDIIGPYELHDFFLYHTVRFGSEPGKVLFLAEKAFAGEYSTADIKKWLKVFYRRFFTQQFKRSCLPDGPKVGSVSLSPRGDWRMPSDADGSLWIREIDDVQ
ncbi:NAD(+) synthase [Thermoanaerobacterium sp. DL9XJH110]|uniref:NAD(+) synthase n=1 Tax=Thermoanaerobacterium sp. DL9XJH110 TaxID=3386643 RepID=UPI003BB76D0F